jgi:hypothetical protein
MIPVDPLYLAAGGVAFVLGVIGYFHTRAQRDDARRSERWAMDLLVAERRAHLLTIQRTDKVIGEWRRSAISSRLTKSRART